MTELNLDESLHIQISAIRGDDLGPIQFIFEEASLECDEACSDNIEYTLQDLRGAIFEGEIARNSKTIYILSSDDLIFSEQNSSLILSIPSSVTRDFPLSPLKITIRQILNDVISTRIHGKIMFINNE